MRITGKSNRSRPSQRGAFTLIELMVVITIIVALMALTASAVLKFVGVQQSTNTQSTLDRVQSQLSRAWSKVKDDAYSKQPMTEIVPGTVPPQTISQWIQTTLMVSTDSNATDRIRIIYTKLKLMQAFPMSFNEAVNPYPLPPLHGYLTYLSNLGITYPWNSVAMGTAPFESSACMLMALQRGVSGAGIDPEQLTSGGAAGSLRILSPTAPPGSSIPYLTDGWARPIFFSRAPAGNLYLNPINLNANLYTITWGGATYPVTCYSSPGNNDPGDPQGYLGSTAWRNAYGPLYFTATSEVLPLAANTSYKLAPMVASGGQTNWLKTGTIPPFDPITFYAPSGSGAMFSTPQ